MRILRLVVKAGGMPIREVNDLAQAPRGEVVFADLVRRRLMTKR